MSRFTDKCAPDRGGKTGRLRVTLLIIPKACMNPKYFILHRVYFPVLFIVAEKARTRERGEKVSVLKLEVMKASPS